MLLPLHWKSEVVSVSDPSSAPESPSSPESVPASILGVLTAQPHTEITAKTAKEVHMTVVSARHGIRMAGLKVSRTLDQA